MGCGIPGKHVESACPQPSMAGQGSLVQAIVNIGQPRRDASSGLAKHGASDCMQPHVLPRPRMASSGPCAAPAAAATDAARATPSRLSPPPSMLPVDLSTSPSGRMPAPMRQLTNRHCYGSLALRTSAGIGVAVASPAAAPLASLQPAFFPCPRVDYTARGILDKAAKPPRDVTQRGVTLSYLTQLVDSRVVDASWTIQEVVERFVRPCTQEFKCCLFDMVPEENTGQPIYFVSHTWSRKFGDLLSLLQDHAQQDGVVGAYLWLDIIAINQTPYQDKGCLLNDDVASLAKVVASTQRTLFCLDEKCIVLTRIWCLYEVWQTFLAKGVAGLLVLMPAVDAELLHSVFETFDALQAQATQPADKDRILHDINSSIGSTELNLRLKAALVGSAKYAAEHTSATGAPLADVMTKAAVLASANGQHREAEALYRQALAAMTQALGPEHAVTIASVNNLACTVNDQGRYMEAEPLYLQALAAMTHTLGPDHPHTIAAIANLAGCIEAQGRYAEAETMYCQAVEARTRVLGPQHPDSIILLSSLAACINDGGRSAEAESLYREALDAMSRVFGADHPHTMDSLSNLAACISDQGHNAEAELINRKALEARTRVLGPDHPDVIASLVNLADSINRQGRFAEAEPIHRQALASSIRVLGPEHPYTLSSTSNLAECVQAQGRFAEAESMYREALATGTRTLGPNHPDTVILLSDLATCVNGQGRSAEAEPLYHQAFKALTSIFGPEHHLTVSTLYSLAQCITGLGRLDEAEALMQQELELRAQVSGPDHPDTAFTVKALASNVSDEGSDARGRTSVHVSPGL